MAIHAQSSKTESEATPPRRLFDLKATGHHPLRRRLMGLLASPLEKTLMLTHINDIYSKISSDPSSAHFFDKCLKHFHIRYAVSEADLRKIPTQGPLVTVGNHPFGGLEGVILGAIMAKARPDVKILGNYLLQHLSEIRSHIIPVDVFGKPGARLQNASALKEAIQWTKQGGALITFPAGEVSHLRWHQAEVTDSRWTSHISGIVRHAQSTVLPVYFPGKNSLLFQIMGLLHPLLRTALLPRELANKSFQTIEVYIGKPIPWKVLKDFGSDQAIIQYLRTNTYFLQNRRPRRQRLSSRSFPRARPRAATEIIAPVPSTQLGEDIACLPPENRLLETKEFSVFIASAPQIPAVLREIGRLREITFRDVQEGTGLALDLDRFDDHYLHLFLWNNPAKELAGAYRLGLTNDILRRLGPKGLYTNTLFRFKRGFLAQFENAIELGRSFIISKYQREYSCLAMLWKGIGQFIVRHPQYKILFGPVSISDDYHIVSKRLIVQFLRQNKLDKELARYVRPRVPYRPGRLKTVDALSLRSFFRDIDDISLLISEIEKDGKGIPVLLRHYLKLNASILCFNVDAKFSHVVDGLIRVDLTQTDTRLLRRFMGEEGFLAFARQHDLPPPEQQRMPESASDPFLEAAAP
ncbi:MAG: lysophospholipid acyltransferase family protein [Lentisphaerae bacterium]|nr:lysophospholipid acyltransferase family protein [Lentisphaerota bacterium]